MRAFDFRLGAIERHGRHAITFENGCYLVRPATGGDRFPEGFSHLKLARRYARLCVKIDEVLSIRYADHGPPDPQLTLLGATRCWRVALVERQDGDSRKRANYDR